MRDNLSFKFMAVDDTQESLNLHEKAFNLGTRSTDTSEHYILLIIGLAAPASLKMIDRIQDEGDSFLKVMAVRRNARREHRATNDPELLFRKRKITQRYSFC